MRAGERRKSDFQEGTMERNLAQIGISYSPVGRRKGGIIRKGSFGVRKEKFAA